MPMEKGQFCDVGVQIYCAVCLFHAFSFCEKVCLFFFYLAETIGLKLLWWGRFVGSQLVVVLLIYAVLFKSLFPSFVYVFQLKV